MLNKIRASVVCLAAAATMTLGVANPVHAKSQLSDSQADEVEAVPQVDIVLALDVSGSMSGLIASAKQRLWDIVNEIGRAQPQPRLRLAIISFGRPSYGAESGYVKIDLPFTGDLDAVNRTLFGFHTDGGDEYVARVVSTSVNDLSWTRDTDALRILFVAGNEEATQDPQISMQQATRAAASAGISVNTIYCGSENDSIAAGWRDFATMTNGLFASIDQDSAAVANIATPVDEKLADLNQQLNETYIVFGDQGEEYRENQLEQDQNAGAMSSTAMASRVVTKAGRLYENSKWDVIDAVKAGRKLEEFAVQELPDAMQEMSDDEREQFITQQADKRVSLQAEIQDLDRQRRDYIEQARSLAAQTDSEGLDEVMKKSVRTLAEEKGFTFN